jgi:hypothetical protein
METSGGATLVVILQSIKMQQFGIVIPMFVPRGAVGSRPGFVVVVMKPRLNRTSLDIKIVGCVCGLMMMLRRIPLI